MKKMVNVTKKSGALENFSQEKVKNSMLKAGAPANVAEKIANDIAGKVRDAIPTSEIRAMVISSLRTNNAAWADAYSGYVKPSA